MRKSVFTLLCFILLAGATFAGPIGMQSLAGKELYGTGGEVMVYFRSSDAAFDSLLWLDLGASIGPIFHNHESSSGASVSLGVISAHTKLPFRLEVLTLPNNWNLGPAGLNTDGNVHARVGQWMADLLITQNGYLVGFEDLPGESDFDYNDFEFVVTGVIDHTPEPATFGLLGTALVALGVARFRRRR